MNPFVGPTERDLAGAVAEWSSTLTERIPAAEKAGALPPDLIAELGRLGVLGMTIPEPYGGLGASTVAFALVLEELSAAWPSLAVGVAVNSGIVAGSIVRYGTAEQRRRWLPKLMDGAGLGAFALTEPTSGSDAASLRTTAGRDGSGWRIDGRKQFITNARYAPFAIVLARVGEFDPKRTSAGITAFVVPLDARGVSLGSPERKMGLRASDTSALILEDARVGDDAVLGEAGKGFAIAMSGLDGGRIGIAAQSVGIARRALELARAYSKERKQFGRPIADFEGLRFRIAKAESDLAAARLLALRAAWLRDRGQPFMREAAMAKLYASEMAQRATHAAVQILGGNGYMRDYAVERYARDGRATTIYEGTSEIQRIVIARSLLAA
ncbi:MAG: acyl-CoA dehydrogenase family protein [Chloroflexota bacterium]|nr:acyl-CoA dehydrogenase family protein [Chloroflexota bacterium]